jgi:hypothetical protein
MGSLKNPPTRWILFTLKQSGIVRDAMCKHHASCVPLLANRKRGVFTTGVVLWITTDFGIMEKTTMADALPRA